MFNRLIKLLRMPAARDGGLVIGAQGTAALVALLVDAFLFRKLPKADQGALSSGLALSAILLQASDFGLALTTIRIGAKYLAAGQLALATRLFRWTLTARIVFAAMIVLGASIFSTHIAGRVMSMSSPTGSDIVVVAALGVLGNAVVWWGVDVAQACRFFGSYAAQQIVSALAKALAVFFLAGAFIGTMTDSSAVAILGAIALANFVAGWFSLTLSAGALRTPETTSSEPDSAEHIRLVEFGAYACAVSMLTALSANADVLLVQHYLGVEDTAVFSCARRLAMALNLLATASITVLLPRASALNTLEACAVYVRKAVKAGLILGFVSAGGLALAASVFVPIFGGPKYTASVPILQWLCLAHGISMVLTPLMLVFYPLRREAIVVLLSALQLVVQVVLGVIWTPTYKLEGAAWAIIASKAIVAVTTIFFLVRSFRRVDAVSKSSSIR